MLATSLEFIACTDLFPSRCDFEETFHCLYAHLCCCLLSDQARSHSHTWRNAPRCFHQNHRKAKRATKDSVGHISAASRSGAADNCRRRQICCRCREEAL